MRNINFEEQNENVTNAVWGDSSEKPGAGEVTDMDELNKTESEDSDIEETEDDEDSSVDDSEDEDNQQ